MTLLVSAVSINFPQWSHIIAPNATSLTETTMLSPAFHEPIEPNR